MFVPTIKTYATTGMRDYVRAQQAWMVLTAFVSCCPRAISDLEKGKVLDIDSISVRKPKTITYGDLAILMGYEKPQAGHTLGTPLWLVGHYCLKNGLPALNSIVVNQETGKPGPGVVKHPGREYTEDQRLVMNTHWFKYRTPSISAFRKMAEELRSTGAV